jgi:N-acetylglutamate synthase-like GNAT family acetyltransferase
MKKNLRYNGQSLKTHRYFKEGQLMIREAEIKDRSKIEELYKILIPNDDDIVVLEERIIQIKNDPNNFIFVSEEEGLVRGTLLMHICLDPMYGKRPFVLIENVIVDPSYRGKGIGTNLFNHVEEYCKTIACREILLMSNFKRVEAHKFFEKQGYNGDISRGFKKYLQ